MRLPSRGWRVTVGSVLGIVLTIQFANSFEVHATPAAAAPTLSPAQTAAALTWPLALECTVPEANPGTARYPVRSPYGALSETADGLELRRLYRVHNDELRPIDGVAGVRGCDQDVWRILQATAPAGVRQFLNELMLFDAPEPIAQDESGADPMDETDAAAGMPSELEAVVGEVASAQRSPGDWRFGLRLDGQSDDELLRTIAHELGHLISLTPGQMAMLRRDDAEMSCDSYETFEGCLDDEALLVLFIEDTWGMPTFDAWIEADSVEEEGERQERLADFWDDRRTQFVSDYAATSPEEDFAESFAAWCVDGQESAAGPWGANGSAKRRWMQEQTQLRSTMERSCAVLRALAGR